MPLWSYSTGRKSVNRVRVYERPDSPSLYIEWYDDRGRHQKALRTVTGHPVTDQKLAMRIADRVSQEQEAKRNMLAASAVLGYDPSKTLEDLLTELHALKGAGWSKSHTRDQVRYQKFWLAKLGKETPLTSISEAVVESVAQKTAKAKKWSPRTHGAVLRYLKDAFSFAHLKLKWIDARHALTALDIPSPRSSSRPYTLAEIRKLLPALEEVSPVAGWIGHVAWQSGRRLSAIYQLEKGAVLELTDTEALIQFPAETDKAKATGLVMLHGPPVRILKQLLKRRGRRIAGTVNMDQLQDWIREAEEKAGIQHVKYRGWHGIKRQFATHTQGMNGRDLQAGTDERTLDGTYRQDDLDAKREVAIHQAEALK